MQDKSTLLGIEGAELCACLVFPIFMKSTTSMDSQIANVTER